MTRPLHFVSLSGVPISIRELTWPFRPSTSGADWLVLHGRVDLLDSAEGLHSDVAVEMTQTMKEALGSVAQEHSEGLVVNSIRKTIDNAQLAFMKSGKLQPVHVTTRYYSFRGKTIQFPTQSEAEVREMLKRRVFWLGRNGSPVAIANPYDCQYVNFPREQMVELAKQLGVQGFLRLEGEQAFASDLLLQQEETIVAAMHKGVEAGKAATKVSA